MADHTLAGRAARHVEGRAILFADGVTKSMRAAIEETDRRRAVQEAHNSINRIMPRPVLSNGAGSALMLQVLEEAKRRREGGRAAEAEQPPARGTELFDEPAARALPQ